MKIFLQALSVIFFLFTVLPFIKMSEWWIRIFDFPRLQILVMSLLTLCGYSVYYGSLTTVDVALIAALSLASLYQIYLIHQYTMLHKKQVKDGASCFSQPTIKVITSNVLMSNRNSARFLKIVDDYDPDILLAVETDAWWEQSLKNLDDRYEFSVKVPLANTYGMLLYSKARLHDAEVRYYIENDVPSIHALMEFGSWPPVELHCMHPRPPRPSKDRDTDKRDAELLLLALEVEDSPRPVILLGDLNDVAWSHTTRLFQKISGLLDPRIGRGIFNTFHAKHRFVRWPLDHVFHSYHFRLCSFARLPYFGSDHFPIFIELTNEPDSQRKAETPKPDVSDKREAREKIEEAR